MTVSLILDSSLLMKAEEMLKLNSALEAAGK